MGTPRLSDPEPLATCLRCTALVVVGTGGIETPAYRDRDAIRRRLARVPMWRAWGTLTVMPAAQGFGKGEPGPHACSDEDVERMRHEWGVWNRVWGWPRSLARVAEGSVSP